MGNIVRRVLHIIREEDLSLTTAAMAGLNLASVSDDEDDNEHEIQPVLSAVAVAAVSRSTLRAPSLKSLLEDVPDSALIARTSSSGGDSEGKSKCKQLYLQKFMTMNTDVGSTRFTAADKSSRSRKLKHDVIEAVNELIQDINTCHDQIAEQAVEHIHQKYFPFRFLRLLNILSSLFLADFLLHCFFSVVDHVSL